MVSIAFSPSSLFRLFIFLSFPAKCLCVWFLLNCVWSRYESMAEHELCYWILDTYSPVRLLHLWWRPGSHDKLLSLLPGFL